MSTGICCTAPGRSLWSRFAQCLQAVMSTDVLSHASVLFVLPAAAPAEVYNA